MVLNGRYFMCIGDADKIAPDTEVDSAAPAIESEAVASSGSVPGGFPQLSGQGSAPGGPPQLSGSRSAPGGPSLSASGSSTPHHSGAMHDPPALPARRESPPNPPSRSDVNGASVDQAVAAPAGGTSSSSAPTHQRPTMYLQQGISKPKVYSDGTVRWCMLGTVGGRGAIHR
jgi:hypothetical protein